jgi:malonyl CoA-acyl carrier protein transacylase
VKIQTEFVSKQLSSLNEQTKTIMEICTRAAQDMTNSPPISGPFHAQVLKPPSRAWRRIAELVEKSTVRLTDVEQA